MESSQRLVTESLPTTPESSWMEQSLTLASQEEHHSNSLLVLDKSSRDGTRVSSSSESVRRPFLLAHQTMPMVLLVPAMSSHQTPPSFLMLSSWRSRSERI